MKVISWGKTRDEAISRMRRAIGELRIEGVKTTVPLHRIILADEDFLGGKYTTDLLNKPEIRKKMSPQA